MPLGIIKGMNAQRKALINGFGKAVARQLNARLAYQGMTQTGLAKATGISQSQLSKQLRGLRGINMDELAVICDALDVPMETIIALASADMKRPNVVPMRRPRSNTPPEDVGTLPYAANRRELEPEEGDDDYGPGA